MSVQILTSDQKDRIYDLFNRGYTKAALARMYNVSERTIRRVINELDWLDEAYEIIQYMDSEEDTESFESDEEFDFSEDLDDDEADTEADIAPAFYSFFMDPEHIYLSRNGEEEFNLYRGDAQFEFVLEILSSGAFSQDALRDAHEYLMTEDEEILSYMDTFEIFRDENGFLVFTTDSGQDVKLPVGLTNRINDALSKKDYDELNRLGNFTVNLFDNPSNKMVKELFEFLLATNIEIDDNGYVIAWKRVRGDYKDVYSGKYDNSPGMPVSVDRNLVDEDSEQTCSYGLHVCSKSYLNSYAGERVVKVQVDPKDFVSIPKDYYNGDRAKARVCAYYVLEDVTDNWQDDQ